MKRAFLILILAGFLTACGGGGGNTPSVQMPDNPPVVITPEQQTEARELATMLRGEVANLESSEEANSLLAKIDDLLAEIENAQTEIEKLRAEIAELRADFEIVQMADNTDMQTDNGGNDSPVKSEYDDAEFNANYSLRQMGALYAYENGYFGQGVTIGIDEEIRETHEELAENAVSLTTTITGIRKPVSQNMDGHGTQVIGVAVAARNGKGFHGVAPQAKFLSFDSEMNIEARRTLFMELGIPIHNSSFGFTDTQAEFLATLYATRYAGLDIVHVNSAGNTFPEGHGGQRIVPIIEPSLEPKWIVVAGLDEDDTLNEYSLECGEGRMWCISAYSDGFPTTAHESDTATITTFGGTSIAAPQVRVPVH